MAKWVFEPGHSAAEFRVRQALLHGPEQIADLPDAGS